MKLIRDLQSQVETLRQFSNNQESCRMIRTPQGSEKSEFFLSAEALILYFMLVLIKHFDARRSPSEKRGSLSPLGTRAKFDFSTPNQKANPTRILNRYSATDGKKINLTSKEGFHRT